MAIREIMRAAVAGKGDSPRTKVFAISVLTSPNDASAREMGYALPVAELIKLRVRQAVACGCDGIIASADDDPNAIRTHGRSRASADRDPGIREAGGALDDHKRHATPAQAIARGADYLVVGRPITQADDPAAAARTDHRRHGAWTRLDEPTDADYDETTTLSPDAARDACRRHVNSSAMASTPLQIRRD